ncbi:MAG: hypothetical protein BA871_13635 [Desulfuromonadales bacterium C00003096]|nr:MAG: hypothetical protein BA871_13635 [Desulfuromonadales bacterium C00003096]
MIPHLRSTWSRLFERCQTAGSNNSGKLGTFVGVFIPTVLTILGVIMYLRFGWVVGHVGLWQALFIVLLANAITFITALSLSAVATNSRVGSGARSMSGGAVCSVTVI